VPACFDAAVVHHDDAIGHLEGFFLVVRLRKRSSGESRHAGAAAIAALHPHFGVEGSKRLIEQQDSRLHGQRAGQCDALPLASRELRRIPACAGLPARTRCSSSWTRLVISSFGRRRTRMPKATFSNTDMCRNRA